MSLKLFLSIATDPDFDQILEKANPSLVKLWIGGGDYLCEIFLKGQRYLGKPVAFFTTVRQLENLEAHLLSLLKKLDPDYSFSKNTPLLITIPDDS